MLYKSTGSTIKEIFEQIQVLGQLKTNKLNDIESTEYKGLKQKYQQKILEIENNYKTKSLHQWKKKICKIFTQIHMDNNQKIYPKIYDQLADLHSKIALIEPKANQTNEDWSRVAQIYANFWLMNLINFIRKEINRNSILSLQQQIFFRCNLKRVYDVYGLIIIII